MTYVLEEVPSVNSEDSDGSVHSHIFPTSKAPPATTPTPARKKKVPAKKPPPRIASSIAKISILDDLAKVFAPKGQITKAPTSPQHMASQVFEFPCFFTP